MDPQSLLLCTNPIPGAQSASWGWSAVQLSSSACNGGSCPNSILQIGRGACRFSPYSGCQNGTAQRLFVAYGRDNEADGCSGLSDILPVPNDRGAAPTDTGIHYYRVYLDGSTWRFDHWPKGKAVTQTFTLADSIVCWTARDGVTFNETWDRGDALGGTSTNHYNFLSMTRLTAGGAWQATLNQPCGHTVLPEYNCLVTGQQAWEAWTDR